MVQKSPHVPHQGKKRGRATGSRKATRTSPLRDRGSATPLRVLIREVGPDGSAAVRLGFRSGDVGANWPKRPHSQGKRRGHDRVQGPIHETRQLVQDRPTPYLLAERNAPIKIIQVPTGTPLEDLSRRTEDGGQWPWPTTSVSPRKGPRTAALQHFSHEESGLYLCGYRVGLHAMSDVNRQRLLRDIFMRALPRSVRRMHGDAYGEPQSCQRLRKMAEVMAANCRNFKRIDRSKYAAAIHDYERDLEFLYQTFYLNRFPWPSVA